MSDIFGMAELETIERLADIINEKELSEVTITDGGKSITIKGKKCPPPPPMQAMGAPVPVQQPVPAAQPQQSAAEPKLTGKVVKSPIVGTYYAAPSPEKPAFVKVGDKVSKGDVIMIIESMKLMNEIQSDFDGIVDKILVSDGQAVEYDQPLMIIR
jgi:acetyl-CoA carboxylase biotin carboxyl carrier protein